MHCPLSSGATSVPQHKAPVVSDTDQLTGGGVVWIKRHILHLQRMGATVSVRAGTFARRWAIEQRACYVQRRCVRSLAQMLAPRLPQSLRQSGWQEVKLAETQRMWPTVAGACSGGLRQGGTAQVIVCVCVAGTQQWRHMGCLPDMMASGAVWRREGEAPPTVVCCPDATAARFHTRTQPSAAPPATRRGWLARATSTAYSTPAFAPTSLCDDSVQCQHNHMPAAEPFDHYALRQVGS